MGGAEIGLAQAFPAALSALGTIFQMNAQNDAAKRQRAAVSRAEEIAADRAARARAAITANAERYRPEARGEELQKQEGDVRASLDAATSASPAAPVSTLGATSEAYKGALRNAEAATAERTGRLNTLFAKTLAPGRASVREGIGDASTAEQVNSLFSTGQRAMNAGATDASAITPSGTANLIAGGLSGLGHVASKRKLPTLFQVDPFSYNQEFTP